MHKIVHKNDKLRNFIILFFLFLFALVLIFKNFVLFSNEVIYQYSIAELSAIECDVTGNTYTPLTENSAIQIYISEVKINNLRINFSETLNTNTTFNFYLSDNTGNNFKIYSKTANAGDSFVDASFKDSSNVILSIKFNETVSLSSITLKWKELNLLQKNFVWLFFEILVMILALMLSVLIIKNKSQNAIQKENKNERKTNYELLRIICMFFIIIHHCVVHGGILSTEYISNKIIACLFIPVGKICFIVFLAISMWFLVDSKFNASKFMKIWFEVLFYSLLIVLVVGYMTDSLTFKNILGALFPIAGNSHGFASAYLMFYLLLPFIGKITKDLTKKQARFLLFLLFYAQIFTQILGVITGYYQQLYSELTLFIFCYILTLNLKKWPFKFLKYRNFLFLMLIAIYLTLVQCNWVSIWGRNNKITDFILGISGSESSILIIIAGYAIFIIVRDINIKSSLIINRVASYTFGVLLIHDHNFLRTNIWDYFVETEKWYASRFYFLFLLASGIGVFFVCSVIEYCRQELIEKSLIQTSISKKLIQKFNYIF